MSDICKECGSTTSSADPNEIGLLLKKHTSLWNWGEYEVGTEVTVAGLGLVKVVHNSYLGNDGGSIKLVWETRHGYVGIEGYSSCCGSEWSGDFMPAEKKTKEVVFFE